MPAPIRRRCASRSGCAATSAASRIATARAPTARRSGVDAPSYVIAAPAHESDEEVAEFNPVIIAEIDDGH